MNRGTPFAERLAGRDEFRFPALSSWPTIRGFPRAGRNALVLAVVGLLLFLFALGVGAGEPLAAPGGLDPASVHVVDLPQGHREIVGCTGFTGHALHITPGGNILAWSDLAGNTPLATVSRDLPVIEVLDPSEGNKRVWPSEQVKTSVARPSAGRAEIVFEPPGGARVVCVVEPARWGLQVQGPKAEYLVRGRSPCRAEGCRIVAPGQTRFVSAGLEKIEGLPQVIVDPQRTRALQISPTEGSFLTWQLLQTDGWAWTKEHVAWQAKVRAGQTIWLASVPLPRHDGPAQVGFYLRRMFRPEGQPVAVATLSSLDLNEGVPLEIRLSRRLDEVVKGGVLLAAMLPVAPEDAIETAEQGAWFTRFDAYSRRLIGLDVEKQSEHWTVRRRPSTPPGVYRMRLWIAPSDAPRPEALGGPKGAAVGYFPGFEGRGSATGQPYPVADVLVTVADRADGSASVYSPSLRESFWRGESVLLAVRARAPGSEARLRLVVRHEGTQIATAERLVRVALNDGAGTTELSLSTAGLAPGVYEARASAEGLTSWPYRFTIAPLPASGMPVINSPMTPPGNLDTSARLGATAWADVLPSPAGLAPAWPAASGTARGVAAADPRLPLILPAEPGPYDRLAARGWSFLQGVQSRQISFGLHHSIEEHEEETLRKHLVYAQFGRRFPSTLGLVLDYDLAGVGAGYGFAESYVEGMKRKMALLAKRWDAVWAEAQRAGAAQADEQRLRCLFHAEVIGGLYRRSIESLHAHLPEQRHTSAVTADHAYLQDGQYLPAVYRPLDLRYLEAWNDQIYPNSAHDMQESFWTSLLRMERPAGQPLWITVPTAPQPGTHLRRSLEAIARGASGIGYGAEGAAGLTGGWGADSLRSDVRTAQEILTGDMARRYGTWLNEFEPAEEVGILYSVSQDGTNYGLSSPVFFAYFTLAQINRPARLVTEDEIVSGALKSLKALVIVRQTAALPQATLRAIEAFASAGGRVLCDADTKLAVRGSTRLEKVSWPAGLWPRGGNTYHKILQSFPQQFGPALVQALGPAGRQPLECADRSALVVTKTAPGAQLIIVTNNREYPLEEPFDAEQQKAAFLRRFRLRGSVFYKDVRVPGRILLWLRQDLAASPPRVFDVFAGRELSWEQREGRTGLSVDLVSLPGRVLMLMPRPVPAPSISVARRPEDSPLATLVIKSPMPLPIRVRVGSQEIWRAATPGGSCDTVALGPEAGDVPVEVTELLTGTVQRGVVRVARPAQAVLKELPAVQVWDAARVRQVLKAPRLAVYVDARQAGALPLARRAAERLGGEVVFNPAVLDYPLSWNPSPAIQAANERIRGDGLLGWRRLLPETHQWTGALCPAAVWRRPVLLFGHAQNNRLIADLNQATVLARPADAETLAHAQAYVQPVAAPFWQGHDAVVVLCADATGLQAAVEQLTSIAGGHELSPPLLLADDGGARAEHRRVAGFEPTAAAKDLTPLPVTATTVKVGLDPLLPLSGIVPVRDGLLATLHSPGQNFTRLDAQGGIRWQSVSGGFYQPVRLLANTDGESLVDDGTILWRHDPNGKLRWKMLGQSVHAPLADGSVWVASDGLLHRVAAEGQPREKVAVDGAVVAMLPGGAVAVVQRPGERGKGREKADAALAAVRLADNVQLWSVPNLDASEVQLSRDGHTLALIEHEDMAGRDDLDRPDASRLTLVDAATGKVLLRRPLGVSLAGLVISADGRRAVADERDFGNSHYVVDVPSGLVRRFSLPEPGAWAKLLPTGGKTLWVACERLWRVDLETLDAKPLLDRRLLQLAEDIEDGLWAGASDGRVLRLDSLGRVRQELNLTAGLAMEPARETLAALRQAPVVLSPDLKPHEVPATILLAKEYPLDFMIRGDFVVVRGDGIQPAEVAVRFPEKGRYRFTLVLKNPKEQTARIGSFQIQSEGREGPQPQTAPLGEDRLRQAVEQEVEAGTQVFVLKPIGWQTDAHLHTLTVERAR